jgi:hypothetical protein
MWNITTESSKCVLYRDVALDGDLDKVGDCQVCRVVDMWVNPTFTHSIWMSMETGPNVGWVEHKGPVHGVGVATGCSTLRIQPG